MNKGWNELKFDKTINFFIYLVRKIRLKTFYVTNHADHCFWQRAKVIRFWIFQLRVKYETESCTY